MSKSKLDKNFRNGKKFGAIEINLDSLEFDDIDRAIEEEKIRNRRKNKKKPNRNKYEKYDDYDS